MREELRSLHQQRKEDLEKTRDDMRHLQADIDRERHAREMSSMKYDTLSMEHDELQRKMSTERNNQGEAFPTSAMTSATSATAPPVLTSPPSVSQLILSDAGAPSVSSAAPTSSGDAELDQLRQLVQKLSSQKIELQEEKDQHISQLHSELQNLEVELEHVHTLHDQKHQDLLQLQDTINSEDAMVSVVSN